MKTFSKVVKKNKDVHKILLKRKNCIINIPGADYFSTIFKEQAKYFLTDNYLFVKESNFNNAPTIFEYIQSIFF